MQMVNDNPLPQECESCITFCNEGEKINLLYTVMKFDSFQVDMSVWVLTDWPDLVSWNEPLRKFLHDSSAEATSCHRCRQETLNMPVGGVDKFITALSQSELRWHDLDRSQAERQMAIKDNHVTVCTLA